MEKKERAILKPHGLSRLRGTVGRLDGGHVELRVYSRNPSSAYIQGQQFFCRKPPLGMDQGVSTKGGRTVSGTAVKKKLKKQLIIPSN